MKEGKKTGERWKEEKSGEIRVVLISSSSGRITIPSNSWDLCEELQFYIDEWIEIDTSSLAARQLLNSLFVVDNTFSLCCCNRFTLASSVC